MKKTNLKFYNNVKPLEIKEYKYWRRLLPKVLKVGAELEFNLERTSGNCKGHNINCICDKLQTRSCTPKCVLLKNGECTLCIKNTSCCINASTACATENCENCENFKFKCGEHECLHYIAECITCDYPLQRCLTCNKKYDVNKNPDNIRKSAEIELDATQNFGYVGTKGVLQVVKDGSLQNGGLEIPTVGRRLSFDVFKDMFKNILSVVKKNGGYINDRCSFHVHILNEYYTKVNNEHGMNRHPDNNTVLNLTSFEKKLPNIVLTNIIQLWRYYETALFWMSCGLPDLKHVTRWEKFRVSILKHSPIFMSFSDIMDEIANVVGHKRYGSLNLSNTKLDGSRLHLEFRICDMVKSESYMASMCCLFYAIIIKAVDISCYGLLNVEDPKWLAKEQCIKNDIINGATRSYDDHRCSNTLNILNHKEYLVNKSLDMINLLSPILSNFYPAEQILKNIAQEPVALRLNKNRESNGWTTHDIMNTYDIESDLSSTVNKKNDISEEEKRLLKTIALGELHGCSSIKSWITSISEDCGTPVETIEEYINNLSDDIYWDRTTGSYIYKG